MKRIKHLTQFAIINILFFVFKILGFKISSYLGYLIGRYIGPIFKPKTLIIKNLEKANIESNHYDIASNVLGNYGRILAEYVHLKNFRNDKLKNYISIDGIEYLQHIKKNKQTSSHRCYVVHIYIYSIHIKSIFIIFHHSIHYHLCNT